MGHIEQLKSVNKTLPIDLDFRNLIDAQIHLTNIAQEFDNNWKVFSGLKCLDICCGSVGSNSEGHYPWLVTLLSGLGAEVTGLDIGDQPIELVNKCKFIKFDLLDLDERGLSQIPEIGNSKYNLITFLNTINPMVSSPMLIEMVRKKRLNLRTIQERVLANIDDLLEPNGILYMDTLDGWQKTTRKKRL